MQFAQGEEEDVDKKIEEDDAMGDLEELDMDELADPDYGEEDYGCNYFSDGDDDGDGHAYGKDGTLFFLSVSSLTSPRLIFFSRHGAQCPVRVWK
jgi:hypothetical protein